MAITITNFRDLVQIPNTVEFQHLFNESNFGFTFSNALKDDIVDIDAKCGFPLSRLNTVDKTSLIDSINENNAQVLAIKSLIGDLTQISECPNSNVVSVLVCILDMIGDLNLLETTDKSSIVAAINSNATETNRGTVEIATQIETDDGASDAVALTPAKLLGLGAGPVATHIAQLVAAASVGDATEIAKGVAELATQGEADTGVDDSRIITPLKLRQMSPNSTTGIAISNLTLAAAESVAGKIAIATSAEVTTGVNDTKAITPVKLASAINNISAANVTFTPHGTIATGTNAQVAIEQVADSITGLKLTDMADGPGTYAGSAKKWISVNAAGTGFIFGDRSFLDLGDTPSGDFASHLGEYVKVNSTGTALEFRNLVQDIQFLTLPDAPATFATAAQKVVRVRADEAALEFADLALADLSDIPNSYAGLAGKYLKVLPDETGVVFDDFAGEDVWFSAHVKDPKIPLDTMWVHIVAKTLSLPQNLTGSFFIMESAPLTTIVFEIHQNNVQIGTLSWLASANTPSVTFANNIILSPGDRISIKTQLVVDDNTSDFVFTLKGTRTFP